MEETPKTLRSSNDEAKGSKQQTEHLEEVITGQSIAEIEKGEKFAPVVATGPVVHEKVRPFFLCHNELSDPASVRMAPFLNSFMHVLPLGRVADSIVPFWLSSSDHLPGHWGCRPLRLVCHWIPDS